ncbi:hypothetical protein L6R52_19805 [Myxococcota bacterium]|nr:hypothetical protein [Myxococcota bacterium]
MRALTALFVVLALPACRNGDAAREVTLASAPTAKWTPARTAEVYFSTEVGGYVEPCGCTTKPLGGLQRLATVIGRGAKDHILVDAGNLVLPVRGLGTTEREQHLLKSRIVARAYRRLGAAALNVAEADLAAGTALLEELQREGAFPLVSANVRPVGSSGPSIARSFIRVVGDIRIGLTGVATPEHVANVRGLAAIEYAPAVRAEVSSLRRDGAEVIIVLAHVGEAGARELARAVPEIDVIVRGPGSPIDREPAAPEQIGGVLVVEAGSQGQHVGKLTLALGPKAPERPLVVDEAGAAEVRRRALLERKIRAYGMELDAWRVDPSKVETVKVREAKLRELEAELARPLPVHVSPEGPHLSVQLLRLDDEIPADPEISRLLAAYYGQLREMNLDRGDTAPCAAPAATVATYVGTAKCVECHEEAYAFWKKTKHGTAWATLEEAGKHFDLTCVGCHTVGYQQPGGFCRLKDVEPLKDVGCESCHGPGSRHVADEDASSISLAAPESTCTATCHVPDHSDAFVYEKYVRLITGPGHVLGGPAASPR